MSVGRKAPECITKRAEGSVDSVPVKSAKWDAERLLEKVAERPNPIAATLAETAISNARPKSFTQMHLPFCGLIRPHPTVQQLLRARRSLLRSHSLWNAERFVGLEGVDMADEIWLQVAAWLFKSRLFREGCCSGD